MDRGTAVHVRLPAAPPPTVLVVTDEQSMGETLRRAIEARGYAAQRVSTGQEALGRCAAQQVDLLVLDLRLPDMDGTELVLLVRDDRRTQRLPAIVLARETLARPKLDILQRFNIPALAMPWRETEILSRIAAAFSGRGLAPRAGG